MVYYDSAYQTSHQLPKLMRFSIISFISLNKY